MTVLTKEQLKQASEIFITAIQNDLDPLEWRIFDNDFDHGHAYGLHQAINTIKFVADYEGSKK